MANYRFGRVALHLICILRDGAFRMHMSGLGGIAPANCRQVHDGRINRYR